MKAQALQMLQRVTGFEPANQERAFLPAALEIIETPASPTARLTALGICAVFAIALIWAAFGKVDEVAVAPGKIIASGRTKVIQPFEIGTVRAIHVQEGDRVKAGDVLIELDPTTSTAEHDRAAKDLARARLDIVRLKHLLGQAPAGGWPEIAGADPNDLRSAQIQEAAQRNEQQAKLDSIDRTLAEKEADAAGVRATLAKIAQELPVAEERAAIRKKGIESGFGSEISYLEAEQQALDLKTEKPVEEQKLLSAEAAIDAARQYRQQTAAEFEKGLLVDLAKAQEQADAATEALEKATQRGKLERLTAPVDGVVQGLTVHTLGGVVTPAEQVLTVVPSEGGLEVEAIVDNKDIGFVSKGQKAEIKVETFPFTRYGLRHGVVSDVSMDSVAGDSPDSRAGSGPRKASDEPAAIERSRHLIYTAHVTLDRPEMLVDGREVPLIPGMAVTAEIKTGRRSVLSYLLSPLNDYWRSSLRER